MSVEQEAKGILANNRHMTVATADKSGKPWVSPVFFTYDDHYNLYWVSNKDALHSRNIRLRPQVAISIMGPAHPGGKVDGLYFDAEACELENPAEIRAVIEHHYEYKQTDKFKVKTIDDVTGDAAWRLYKATPKTISKRADGQAHRQAITIRVGVKL